MEGASAKQRVRLIGISPYTVEFRGANVMRKVGARTIAGVLARMIAPKERGDRQHGFG